MADVPTDWWQGKRGEWYVILQVAFLAIVVLGPITYGRGARWPDSAAPFLEAFGLVLVGAGFMLSLAAITELRRNLSPLPAPKPAATLVTSGPYRLVRHPIYGGLALFALGWSLAFGGWVSLASAAALAVVLERKAVREELLLLARFPDYQEYRRRTRRFLPYLF